MLLGDKNLLNRLRLGDRDAYVEVAERFSREIWAYIYRLCRNAELASDICQETAITVWREAPEFVGVTALRAWMYKVAHNTYVDHCRRSRLPLVSLDEASLMTAGQDVATEITAKVAMESQLARLPDEIRHALILTKVQGLTCAEAATVMDTPVGTVKWRVSQGLKMLREKGDLV